MKPIAGDQRAIGGSHLGDLEDIRDKAESPLVEGVTEDRVDAPRSPLAAAPAIRRPPPAG